MRRGGVSVVVGRSLLPPSGTYRRIGKRDDEHECPSTEMPATQRPPDTAGVLFNSFNKVLAINLPHPAAACLDARHISLELLLAYNL